MTLQPATACTTRNPTSGESACSLLPTELLYTIVAIVQPRAAVPASSREIKAICTTGIMVGVAWRNGLFLWDREPRNPHSVSLPPDDDEDEFDPLIPDTPDVAQLVLVARLPRAGGPQRNVANAFAPTRPAPDPFITEWYLHALYSSVFFRNRHQSNKRKYPCGPLEDTLAWFDWNASNPSSTHCWWRPVTDALMFPVYLIRSGQLDLLDYCLDLFSAHAVTLHGLSKTRWGKWPCWTILLMDERPAALQCFDHLAQAGHASSSGPTWLNCPLYAHFLVALALLEWSVPTLELLVRRFPYLAEAIVVDMARFLRPYMLSLLASPPDQPERIIQMCRWYTAHDVYVPFPLISYLHSSDRVDFALRVLAEVDKPRLATTSTTCARDLSTHLRSLMSHAVVWFRASPIGKHLVDVMVGNGLIDVREWWEALLAVNPIGGWQVLQHFFPGSSADHSEILLQATNDALFYRRRSVLLLLVELLQQHSPSFDSIDFILRKLKPYDYAPLAIPHLILSLGKYPSFDPLSALHPVLALLHEARDYKPAKVTHSPIFLSTIVSALAVLCTERAASPRRPATTQPAVPFPHYPMHRLVQSLSRGHLAMVVACLLVSLPGAITTLAFCHSDYGIRFPRSGRLIPITSPAVPTALADTSSNHASLIASQNDLVVALIPHLLHQLALEPHNPAASFVDYLTPTMRTLVAHRLRGYSCVDVWNMSTRDRQRDRLQLGPASAHDVFVASHFALLDPQHVATFAGQHQGDLSVADSVKALVHEDMWLCGQISWAIVKMGQVVNEAGIHEYWREVTAGMGTEQVVKMKGMVVKMTNWAAESYITSRTGEAPSWLSYQRWISAAVSDLPV